MIKMRNELYEYHVDGGHVVIDRYIGDRRIIAIVPPSIGGIPVKGIEDDAFYVDESYTYDEDGYEVTILPIYEIVLPKSFAPNTQAELSRFVSNPEDVEIKVEEGEINGLHYYLNSEGHAVIFKYDGKGRDVIIPSEIDGAKVVRISSFTFENGSLESLVIPSSVIEIGDWILNNCTLKRIVIGNLNTKVSARAFSGCSLEKVEISSAEFIGKNWLSGFNDPREVVLPEKLVHFYTPFDMRWRLADMGLDLWQTQVYVRDENGSVKDHPIMRLVGEQDGLQYYVEDDRVIISRYVGSEREVIIPSEIDGMLVEGISKNFKSKNPVSITIPDSVEEIGRWAFYRCDTLIGITIPDSVNYIADDAFRGCRNLKSLTIPDSVQSINYQAFAGCKSLESVTIPNSVDWIGGSAFMGCSSLKNLLISNSVPCIKKWTFHGCSSLESVTIPDSVTEIEYSAFGDCDKLKYVELPAAFAFKTTEELRFMGFSNKVEIKIRDR